MDFRDIAAKEASELAARLTTSATLAAEQAVKHAEEKAQKVADGLRDQLQAAVKEKTASAALLKEARTQGERLQQELHAAADRIDLASRQLDEARKAAEKLEAARTELTAARDEQARLRKDAEAELRKTREVVETLRGELASAMKTLEKAAAERLAAEEAAGGAHSQSQAAEAKLAAVTELFKKSSGRVKTLEHAQQMFERRIHELETKLQGVKNAPAAAPAASSASVLDELVSGFQALSGATTIGEMLTTLVEQMAAQFPRVALFRVKKGHLQGEHQIGFDLKTDIAKVVLPLGMDSLPSRAASSGQIESLSGDEVKDTPFNGTPTYALALPIAVGAETVAIVYADNSGAPAKARGTGADEVRARYAEAMRQYVVAVLMRLTNELKVLAELQKYATSLLHEIEQMHAADLDAGLSGADLQKRLSGNLDYARSIYGSRTALEGADAGTLIEDEIVALLEARKGTTFAEDLAAAIGRPQGTSRSAEAS